MKDVLKYICLLGIIIFSFGCDNCEDPSDPLCGNYDPCYGLEAIVPDFSISTGYISLSGNFEIFFYSDTLLYGTLFFKSNIENAISYQWTVGTDNKTWDTQNFALFFDDADSSILRYNPVPVTLIVQREISDCFPEDDGIDTITKYIHFRSIWEAAYLGKWEGSRNTAPDYTYQLSINYIKDAFGIWYDEYFYNLYGEGDDCFHKMARNGISGYREAYNNEQGRSLNWEECGRNYYSWTRKLRIAVNTAENTISMNWEEWYSDDGDVQLLDTHTFTGKRPN